MPATVFSASSIGSVICACTTSAAAPGYAVVIEMVGGSTDGYSRTPSSVSPMMPNSVIRIDMTTVSTGRRMLISARVMGLLACRLDELAGAHLLQAGSGHDIALFEAGEDVHGALQPRARLHRAALGLVILTDDVHVELVEPGNDGDRRHQDGFANLG